MHTNGTLIYSISPILGNGGLDGNGDPIDVGGNEDTQWSEPINCLIKVNKRDNIGYMADDNKFQTARYIIHIEEDHFEENATIKLSDDLNRDLGSFKVRDLQRSRVCNRIQFLV